MNGSILPLQQSNPWASLSSGVGDWVYWLYIPFYRPPGKFSDASGNAQRMKLFICSKLFICVFEILNPGGPLINMIFVLFCYFVRSIKGFMLIHNKHLYFFHFNVCAVILQFLNQQGLTPNNSPGRCEKVHPESLHLSGSKAPLRPTQPNLTEEQGS